MSSGHYVVSRFEWKLERVGITGRLLGRSFGDVALNCVRTERLESAKSPNLRKKKCSMISKLGVYVFQSCPELGT